MACLMLSYSVIKHGSGDFTLLIASVNSQPPAVHEIEHQGKVAQLKIQYGDFSEELTAVVKSLREVCLSPAYTHHS